MGIGAGLIISETTPAIPGYETYVWYKPSTREYCRVLGATWEWFATEPLPIELNNIVFTGTITAGDKQGKSQTVVIAGTKLKFHHGIFYDSEPA